MTTLLLLVLVAVWVFRVEWQLWRLRGHVDAVRVSTRQIARVVWRLTTGRAFPLG